MSDQPVHVRAGLLAPDARPDQKVALRASRCPACGLVAFPMREVCEACSAPTTEIALSTRAVLAAHTEVIHPPPDSKVPVPYGVGLVTFPEGIAILGLLDDELRQTARIGSAVETFAYEAFPGHLTYGFRVAD